MIAFLLLILSAVASYFGVQAFRRRSIKRRWIDVPNERSSHVTPTPRGGGLVIVGICLVAYPCIAIFEQAPFSWGYYVGALLIVIVSWLDDVYSIRMGWRFLVHFLSALLLVANTGYWHEIGVPGFLVIPLNDVAGVTITVLWIVWVINAYNFMDGIDGIAGTQAVVAGTSWAVVAWSAGDTGFLLYMTVLVGAVAGFLVHNWHPARIFMGDVGSSFLGFTFGAAPLLIGHGTSGNASLIPIASALFLWPFLFDAFISRFRRLFSGQPVWAPHREHLYQRLVDSGYSQAAVSGLYGLFAIATAATGLYVLYYAGNASLVLISSIVLLTAVFALFVIKFARPVNLEKHAEPNR